MDMLLDKYFPYGKILSPSVLSVHYGLHLIWSITKRAFNQGSFCCILDLDPRARSVKVTRWTDTPELRVQFPSGLQKPSHARRFFVVD